MSHSHDKHDTPNQNLEDVVDAEVVEAEEVLEVEEVPEQLGTIRPARPVPQEDIIEIAEDADGPVSVAPLSADDEDVLAVELSHSDAPISFPFPQSDAVRSDEATTAPARKSTAPDSSVINWNEISSEEEEVETPKDKTVAFDDMDSDIELGHHTPTQKPPSSGYDPVAEELESGVLREGMDSELIEGSTEHDQLAIAEEEVTFDEMMEGGDEEVRASLPLKDLSAEQVVEEKKEEEKPKKAARRARAAEEAEAAKEVKQKLIAMDSEPVKPRSGMSLVGGILVGLVVAVGGAGAVWYFAPDLIPASPNQQKPVVSTPKMQQMQQAALSPSQTARSAIEQGNYETAIETLKDAPREPANLSTLAEAQWLKYLKGQADKKAPVSENDADVKTVLEELKEAKNDLLTIQITEMLAAQKLREGTASSKDAEESLAELRDAFAKTKLADAKADTKDLTAALAGVVEARMKAEQAADDALKTLVAAKVLSPEDKLDQAAIQKNVKELSEAKANLESINMLLSKADIPQEGRQGVEALLNQNKQTLEKMNEIDQLLATEKIEGGSKGVRELIEAKTALAKERSQLETMLKSGSPAPAPTATSSNPLQAIVDAVKSFGQKSPAPVEMKPSAPKEVQPFPVQPPQNASQPKVAPRTTVAPESVADPYVAEQSFGKGLHLFWAQRYAEAETELAKATTAYNKDARYFYFLGLSQLAQRTPQKREAASAALAHGARLEAQNLPSREEVNMALERVPAELRAAVNQFREKNLAQMQR